MDAVNYLLHKISSFIIIFVVIYLKVRVIGRRHTRGCTQTHVHIFRLLIHSEKVHGSSGSGKNSEPQQGFLCGW